MTIETTTSHTTTAFTPHEFREKLLNGFSFTGPITVKGDLDLSDLMIKSLPTNIHVIGKFAVPKELKVLPKGLIVEDSLTLSGSGVEELTQDLEVHGSLLASGIPLTSLPAAPMKLYGDIDLQGTKLAQIPEWITQLGPIMDMEESLVKVGNKSKMSGLKSLIEAGFMSEINFKLSEPQKISKVAQKSLYNK